MITLDNTTASRIAAQFVRARRDAGSPAMGMVMTLVVVAREDAAAEAMEIAQRASQEHPARVLALVMGDGRGAARVDADISTGSGRAGETALIRLKGEVVRHAESVVLPLLLPDSPVVVWWPVDAPTDPAADPIGQLAQRRITDAAAVTKQKTTAIAHQCRSYAAGNTDLAWTRLTPWRALLAAALDQHTSKVTGATVIGERISPSTELMVAWLTDRLRVPVARESSQGTGIAAVVIETADGDVVVRRLDERVAELSIPGSPTRPVPLARRTADELLSEELRHLDEDDVYADTARRLVRLRDAVEGDS
ncbi:glucose-6-phosphate dehydrogenase assembly protein OpcA [Nocardioides yefusunii]|uniref:Glucose-6-phosphate dehydrogenase assembly protein OpcA n=1 Tax=Nocardioides yefusunii TaxID=2500546 RepID=A0ABW1R3U6_9ACTN|nr:glucose-6-phosphate dehydrogenase assembly protein OpcA [Nocardioides yefusunii]